MKKKVIRTIKKNKRILSKKQLNDRKSSKRRLSKRQLSKNQSKRRKINKKSGGTTSKSKSKSKAEHAWQKLTKEEEEDRKFLEWYGIKSLRGSNKGEGGLCSDSEYQSRGTCPLHNPVCYWHDKGNKRGMKPGCHASGDARKQTKKKVKRRLKKVLGKTT